MSNIKYRRDIDGLRAVAILSVVNNCAQIAYGVTNHFLQ